PGATVAFESVKQIGSFDFTLTDPSSAVEAVPTPSDVLRLTDLTVVLAEPSRAQTSIVRKYLAQLGIEKVHAAGSGREALELAKRPGAQVVLSALHLSDMPGRELAQSLQADPACPGVGFVLASSESDGGDAFKAPEIPRSAVLPKPFDLRQLARSLAQATGRTP